MNWILYEQTADRVGNDLLKVERLVGMFATEDDGRAEMERRGFVGNRRGALVLREAPMPPPIRAEPRRGR
jgi:hypothetical protein